MFEVGYSGKRFKVTLWGLTYRGEMVGLRIGINDRVWDIDRDSLKREFGISHYDIKRKLSLTEHNGVLIPVSDKQYGIKSLDMVEDAEMRPFFEWLLHQNPLVKEQMRGFQLPWNMSLNWFMEDEGWEAIRVVRNDEYNNQHELRMPDGRKYPGGWIGKARTPYEAKYNFHYEITKQALFRGDFVADAAILTYPDLTEWRKRILDIVEGFSRWNNFLVYSHGNKETEIPLDIVITPRYNQRSVVRTYGLLDHVQTAHKQYKSEFPYTLLETICVAINHYLYRDRHPVLVEEIDRMGKWFLGL